MPSPVSSSEACARLRDRVTAPAPRAGNDIACGGAALVERQPRLKSGYGFSAFGDRFTSTPDFAIGLSTVVKPLPPRRVGSVARVTGACVCDASGVKWPRVG